jgi:nicotinate-nucleotide--dimethylbenzimidazole phosphoribosyltransferase
VAVSIAPLDATAMAAARAELDRKTKPRGSLGRLEELAVRLAGIHGSAAPRFAVVVAAADHGYAEEGVSAYPAEVTRQMLGNFASGGAAVSVLAREVGAELVVVDAGVGAGTANATRGPAMSREQALASVARGRKIAAELDATAIALGEMGIGNTTAAAALCAALLGVPALDVCGPGTGLDAAGVRHKAGVVERALMANKPLGDSIEVLAALGGFEIAVLVGVALGAAERRAAVVLDGFIVGAAALVAARIDAAVVDYMIAAHLSPEPGHRLVLDALGLRPLLDLELRLGEGSGAVLALPLLRAALAILSEMATFAEAGVTDAGR